MPIALTPEKARELVSAVCDEIEVVVIDNATGQPTGERFSLDCEAMSAADYTELARRLSHLLATTTTGLDLTDRGRDKW